MSCDPTFFEEGTMVPNTDAKKFMRQILDENIRSRYDNCVPLEDWDGYGWSEDKRVAEEFFEYSNCFVIMTASRDTFNFINYHTFVIDGIIEFQKRVKDSWWFGWFPSWKTATRHLYHINAGWDGSSNGYYLYVQDVDNEFGYTGTTNKLDYRAKAAYFIVRPK